MDIYQSRMFGRYLAQSVAMLWFIVASTVALASGVMRDRLETPSEKVPGIERSLFIDIQKIGARLISVGERGSIAFSDDEGESWQQADVPVSTSLTAIHFPDETHGWAVGHSGVILHSADSGETWVKQFDGFQANLLALRQAEQQLSELKTAYSQADDEEKQDLDYQIEDAEFLLSDAQVDFDAGPAKPLLDVWFQNAQKGYAIGAYGFFFVTNDGGTSWEYAANRIDNIDRYHLNAIQQTAENTLFIVGEAGLMFVSHDMGESWETVFGPYQGSLFGIQRTKQDGVLVYGLRGNVFKTEDQGGSWQKIEVPVSATLTGSDRSPGGIITLVGFSGVVLSSDDEGSSFSLVSQGTFDAQNAVSMIGNQTLVMVSDKGILVSGN